MKDKKIQKTFMDYGFGFPIKLINVPMIKIRGGWTPDINYNLLTDAVLKALCEKPARLTGNEIRFIRLHFDMTLQEFSKRFSVSHPAVIKWEKNGDRPSSMNWATEKDLRLFLFCRPNPDPNNLARLYQALEVTKDNGEQTVTLNAKNMAA